MRQRPFQIYTDHKPLTYALSRSSEPWTARQCRHLSYIAEFSSDIRHINGKDNLVADTLSRPPAGAATLIGPSRAVVRPASVKDRVAGCHESRRHGAHRRATL
jgi:hypothetical protein